jgi:DNA recombination protein RmuC
METTLAFGLGVLAGIFCFWLVSRLRERDTAALALELVRQSEAAKTKEVELLTSNMRDSVKALTSDLITGGVKRLNEAASDSLSHYTSENQTKLDTKKELIDQSLQSMNEKLEQVTALVSTLEKDREQKFGELKTQLSSSSSETLRLRETTEQLRNILSSPAARGQWGERMAEDVLRVAGLVDGINYRRQFSTEGSRTRPDFTFLLPRDLTLNMDVKFPFNSYLAYLECTTDSERKRCADKFRSDVRDRIKEVCSKDYINPGGGTVDYALLFVPNDGVLNFLHECDGSAMDFALERHVVICSPISLYAVLVVIRQALDNFMFERATSEMHKLIADFDKQWKEFSEAYGDVDSALMELQKAFTALTTTRRKQLDRVLAKIDEVRVRQGITADTAAPANGSP